jgi:hypothetical protein
VRTLLVSLLLASSAPAHAEVHGTLTGLVGAQGVSIEYEGGTTGAAFGQAALAGTLKPAGPLLIDGWALGGVPFATSGPRGASVFAVRAGIELENVSAVVGPCVNVARGFRPQLVPSLTVRAGAGDWRGIVGLFDVFGTAPFRVGAEWRGLGLSWVPSLGVEAHGTWPLASGVGVSASLLASKLLGGRSLQALVEATWEL